jgi:putative transposase
MQEKDRVDGDVDAAEVPEVFRRRLDADVDRIIEQAQAEGLQLTGKEGLLGGMIKRAVESAMHVEITDDLGYERYAAEGRGTGNSRNGSTTSTVHTNVGPVELDKPRDRNGSFDSKVVPKGTRRLSEFDDMVLSLFAKGMTTRDIAEHLELTYGASVSHETIANITDAINETVKGWRNRPLEEVYPIIDRRHPAAAPRRPTGNVRLAGAAKVTLFVSNGDSSA